MAVSKETAIFYFAYARAFGDLRKVFTKYPF